MKLMKIASAAAAVISLTLLTGVVAPAARAEVSFDFFYSDLSPHGHWLVSGQYGHVWQPAVYRHGWNPYYDGHWVYSDCGWTWVSDYDWGDVAYHYGTWVDDPRVGWVWVPGYTWAPAWVTFRTGPDYIGWAPVAPEFSVGFSTGSFSFGVSTMASSAFVFVPTRYFAAPTLRSYYVPQTRVTTIINNTTVVNNLTVQNNIVINRGPTDLRTVERATGRTFRPQPIERVSRATPFQSVRREELAVRSDRVRVAEPVAAQQPLPTPMSTKERQDFRRSPEVRQRYQPRTERAQVPSQAQSEAQLQQQRNDAIQRQRREQPMPQQQRDQQAQREAQSRQDQRQQEIQQQRDQQVQQQRDQQAQREAQSRQDQRQQEIQQQQRAQQQPRQRDQQVQQQREQQAQRDAQARQEQRQQEIQRQRAQQQPPSRDQQVQQQQERRQADTQAAPPQSPPRPSKKQPAKKPPKSDQKDQKDQKDQGGGGGNK